MFLFFCFFVFLFFCFFVFLFFCFFFWGGGGGGVFLNDRSPSVRDEVVEQNEAAIGHGFGDDVSLQVHACNKSGQQPSQHKENKCAVNSHLIWRSGACRFGSDHSLCLSYLKDSKLVVNWVLGDRRCKKLKKKVYFYQLEFYRKLIWCENDFRERG